MKTGNSSGIAASEVASGSAKKICIIALIVLAGLIILGVAIFLIVYFVTRNYTSTTSK